MRAKQRAAITHRCFVSRNTHNLVLAFKIYVRPLLEYGSQIWNPFLKYIYIFVYSIKARQNAGILHTAKIEKRKCKA